MSHTVFFHFHVFFDDFSSKNAISAYLRHFCATSGDVDCWLALISKLSNRRRFSASCPTSFFFISMSFSTIFPQKTPFPPTCAIFAPLPVTSGNWRWSADYLKDIGVPLLPPYFFSMSFLLEFLLKNAISASFRHFDAVLTPFSRHFRWHLVLGADHWAGWRNWVRFQNKKTWAFTLLCLFFYT